MVTKKKQSKKTTTKVKSTVKTTKTKTVKKTARKKAAPKKSSKNIADMYRIKLVLKENPLLQGLTKEEMDYFSSHFSLRQISRGEKIFQEGDHGDYLFFVICGRVEVRLENSHNHHILGLYTEGALVGEMAIIDEYPRSATVSALEKSEILILTRTRFNAILEEKPKLGIKLLLGISRVISSRLRNTMGRFFELA